MSSLMKAEDDVVVQIVESSASKKLLRKFPDNFAYKFDYSQSALWSPPIRRFHQLRYAAGQTPLSSANWRLLLDSQLRNKNKNKNKKKVALSKIKTKIHSFALNFDFHSRRLNFHGSNDTGSRSPPAIKKGWEKVLKTTISFQTLFRQKTPKFAKP